MYIINHYKKILLLLILPLIMSGCDDNYISSIPVYPVSLELNLTSTYPTFRNSANEYLIFEKPVKATDRVGFGGILVYSGFDNNYYAFDLACPHEALAKTKVKPNDIGQAVCETCGTVYDISFGIGNPASGPSKEALKRYKTALQGDLLIIYQ
jgi:nitrite reductase/ring-hydroxylating ferredoxin subunit